MHIRLLYVAFLRKSMHVMLLRRAGAEAEGEEEEGHFRLRVIHQAAVSIIVPV